jgi:tripartite-type tricarboxylate transporter receptor subunit TctC
MKTSVREAAALHHPLQPRRNNRPRPKIPSSGQHPRRRFLRLAAGAAALPTVSQFASAQAYPTRPITMIVPLAAGGPNDALARILAERMRQSLGQPVIVENVTGADGSIGVGRAARARPDGYTIEFGSMGPHVLNGALYSLPYDVLNDFAPIAPLATAPFILFARKSVPAKNLNELIVWLKANPNKVSVGIPAASQRLVLALFQKETGTQLIFVPYRGAAPTRQDLAAGRIDLTFDTPDALPLVRAGSINAYAVTSEIRLASAPDIPTLRELGLPISWSTWYSLFAPKGTLADVIAKLNAAAVEALADAAVRSRVANLGLEAFPRERQTPEALGEMVKTDAAKWWPLIKEFGIKPE